jgi:hypothetical protein
MSISRSLKAIGSSTHFLFSTRTRRTIAASLVAVVCTVTAATARAQLATIDSHRAPPPSAKTGGTNGLYYFAINGHSGNYIATDCSNLSICATDSFYVVGSAQNLYAVYRDGVFVDSQWGPVFSGAANFLDKTIFTLPPIAGTYTILRSGVSSSATWTITVTYPPGMNCTPLGCFEPEAYGASTWFGGTSQVDAPLVGDFDEDGKMDDIAYYGACGTGTPAWRINVRTATGFSVQCWGDDSAWFGGTDSPHAAVVGDFDNDGYRDDIAYLGGCGTGPSVWRIHMGRKTHFDIECWTEDTWFAGNTPTETPVVGDFDGDGFIDDITYHGLGGVGVSGWRMHRAQPNHTFITEMWGVGSDWFGGNEAIRMPVVGDFDGDGLFDDIAYNGFCGSPAHECWRVHIGNGNDFATADFGGDSWFGGTEPFRAPVVGDFDRDGRVDDIAYYGFAGSGAGVPCWRVHTSNGSQFTAANYCDDAKFFTNGWISRPLAGQFTADAWTDIVYYGLLGVSECWRAHVHR